MSVKPAVGETVVQETRTRVETRENGEAKRAELWDFVEALTEADWGSQQYRFRIERGRPEWKSDDRIFCADITDKITPVEIARRWGGGDYTIWFKGPPKGQQILYKKLLRIDGSPRPGDVAPSDPHAPPGSAPVSNDPLTRLVDIMDRRLESMERKLDNANGSGVVSDAVKQAVGLTGNVFATATAAAAQTLTGLAGAARPSADDDLDKEFKRAMIQRMLNPPDEMAKFAAMLTAVKGIIPDLGGAARGGNTMAQLAIEAVRVLPAAIGEGVKGLEQWHLAEEARARQVAIMRGGAPQPINVSAQPAAAPPPAPPPVAAPEAKPENSGVVQVSIEQIEIGLVNILNNQTYTIEEAAHRAAALMEDLNPGMPDRVAAAGEEMILNLFKTRPILLQVPQNPRLTEFIQKFIQVVKNAPIVTAQAPPNVPPA